MVGSVLTGDCGFHAAFVSYPTGQEPPMVTKEQFLCTIQVAAAAEQSWRKGSAVDLRSGATDPVGVKAEVV